MKDSFGKFPFMTSPGNVHKSRLSNETWRVPVHPLYLVSRQGGDIDTKAYDSFTPGGRVYDPVTT